MTFYGTRADREGHRTFCRPAGTYLAYFDSPLSQIQETIRRKAWGLGTQWGRNSASYNKGTLWPIHLVVMWYIFPIFEDNEGGNIRSSYFDL